MTEKAGKKKSESVERAEALSFVATRLGGFRSRFAALPPTVLAALLRAEPDEACRKIGNRTDSPVVLSAAVRWGEKIDAGFADGRYGTMPFDRDEFSYFISLIERLDTAMQADVNEGAVGEAANAKALKTAERNAEAVMREVHDKILAAIGKDDAWREDLDATKIVRKQSREDAAVARLRSLAEWVQKVLATPSSDEDLAKLFKVRRVGQREVDALTTAADQYAVALNERPSAAQAGNDSPAVNIAEGRLIYEMRRLRFAAADAREAGTCTLILSPPRALFHVFGLGESDVAEEDEQPPA